ncbi:hypothetical protein V8C40DRAFT_194993 [Trichoderma camerunense]
MPLFLARFISLFPFAFCFLLFPSCFLDHAGTRAGAVIRLSTMQSIKWQPALLHWSRCPIVSGHSGDLDQGAVDACGSCADPRALGASFLERMQGRAVLIPPTTRRACSY